MDDIVYLHGWGENPEVSSVVKSLRRAMPRARIHLPGYHPSGNIRATRVGASLARIKSVLDSNSESTQVRLVGYSFGGLLAALLSLQWPDKVAKMLLLAPAIDNVARNYAGEPSTWRMPYEYVEELKSYPARPRIDCPTTLVHGRLDTDFGGSTPERIEQWAREQTFTAVHLLPGVDHSMEPWLSSGTSPSLGGLLRDLMS
jgi:pimeloyl-ACP methyl ester carboxylesterase